jgi:hypothetical protein
MCSGYIFFNYYFDILISKIKKNIFIKKQFLLYFYTLKKNMVNISQCTGVVESKIISVFNVFYLKKN